MPKQREHPWQRGGREAEADIEPATTSQTLYPDSDRVRVWHTKKPGNRQHQPPSLEQTPTQEHSEPETGRHSASVTSGQFGGSELVTAAGGTDSDRHPSNSRRRARRPRQPRHSGSKPQQTRADWKPRQHGPKKSQRRGQSRSIWQVSRRQRLARPKSKRKRSGKKYQLLRGRIGHGNRYLQVLGRHETPGHRKERTVVARRVKNTRGSTTVHPAAPRPPRGPKTERQA